MATRLKTYEYNIGALGGKYALRDMSNTGKFSNIVIENPVKANFELAESSGLITLKSGSLLTVPFGLSDIDGTTPITRNYRISADKSINVGHVINDYSHSAISDEKIYLIYEYDSDRLELTKQDFGGEELVYRFVDENEYDEHGTLLHRGNTFIHATSDTRCALPLGYFDDAWHWHPFTALGFFKDRMWVDSGFTYYVPRGRKDNYELEIDIINLPQVVYTTINELIAGTDVIPRASVGLLLLDLYGKGKMTQNYQSSVEPTNFDGYEYVSSVNWIYDSDKNIERVCKVCDISLSNGYFNELKNYNTYQTVDFAEVVGRLSDMNSAMVHNDGRAEDIRGMWTFGNTQTFNDIVINGGVINGINIDCELPLSASSKISMTDAEIKPVANRSTNPNCLNITGKSDNAKGGITFGTDEAVKVVGETADSNLNIKGNIVPALDREYNVGSPVLRYKNVYADNFIGVAQSSNWADLAEIYATDKEYPVGTLLQFGGSAELTIAHDEVNAIVSEKPGVLMNAEGEGQPIALAGRVRVRVEGPVKKFQKIYLSNKDGIGTTVGCLGERPIARALENKDAEGEGLVLCAVHFNI